eukprot:COSAG02_NODE_8578_length_2517_cov_1.485112_2_plen_120_part_00
MRFDANLQPEEEVAAGTVPAPVVSKKDEVEEEEEEEEEGDISVSAAIVSTASENIALEANSHHTRPRHSLDAGLDFDIEKSCSPPPPLPKKKTTSSGLEEEGKEQAMTRKRRPFRTVTW